MFTRAVVLTLVGMLSTLPAAAQEPSVDEILRKYYEAIGGLDAWKAVQSMRTVSQSRWAEGGSETRIISFEKRPRLKRTETTVGGVTVIQVFDGEVAWRIDPAVSSKPVLLTGSEARSAKGDIDGLLIGHAEEGHRVELAGLATLGGACAYKLEITRANGDVLYYYIDSERFLPTKLEYREDLGGGEWYVDVFLKDYRDVGGLMIAHRAEGIIQNSFSRLSGFYYYTVEKVELNVNMDDSLFRMPRVKGQDR